MRETGRGQVARSAERIGLRCPTRQRARSGVDGVKAGFHAFEVDKRRESDRAMAVQLDRAIAGRRPEVRCQFSHRVGCEQAPGILQVDAIHLRAMGQRRGALRIVRVRMDLADRVRQPDHDLLGSFGARHRGEALELGWVVRRLGDLEAPDAVADDQLEREPHHLLVGRHPGDEAHPGGDNAERCVRHRGAREADPLPRIFVMESHRHRHVRARGEIERVVTDPVDRRRDREHVRRRQSRRAPQALVAVAQ